MSSQTATFYSPAEERLNVCSHAAGMVLSTVALIVLVARAIAYGDAVHIVSFAIFGASLLLLYSASTIYHRATSPSLRQKLRTFDHAAIYVLIAGTYTPYTLLVLPTTIGWVLFAASWGMAVAGIILKLFYTGRFRLLSTLMYVFMGWIIVFAIGPLRDGFSGAGMYWLFAGGVVYTIGAITYSIKKIPFGHAVFHCFVLAGSVCHFISVYGYILPSP